MPDETTPTPAVPTVSDAANPGAQDDWKRRYDGLVKKVEQLTLANRDLSAQLEALSSEKQQLTAQLGIKDTEKSVLGSEWQKKLEALAAEKAKLEQEAQELRALQVKVKVIKELGRPELLKIADRIPGVSDEEALKAIFSDLASFADDAASAREKQLLAGVTPPTGSSARPIAAPASDDAWMAEVQKAPLGSQERQKVLDDYFAWKMKQT